MRRLPLLLTAVALVAATAPALAKTSAGEVRQGSVYARITNTEVVLGNSVAERRWSRDALRTTALVDKRGQDRTWSTGSRDFSLTTAAPAAAGTNTGAPCRDRSQRLAPCTCGPEPPPAGGARTHA